MTVLDDPKYDVVRSKFALKYTEEKSKEIAQSKGMSVEDVWVYEMQPYSNGTDDGQNGGDNPPPPDVNDNTLNQNDIEGEEPQQREPNPQEKQQQQQQQQQNNQNQPPQNGGDKGEDEDLGWDEDKNSESNSQSDFQSTEETTEENSDTHQTVGGYNMDLIESLNRTFQTDDILSAYKTKKAFISALRLKGEGIRDFAPLVGLDKTATRGEILNKIEEQITPFYQ
jgi:hypothetical protein